MSNQRKGHGSATRHIKRFLLGNVCVFALGMALAMGAAPATAKVKHKSGNDTERVSKEPFGQLTPGPLQIFVSIEQQKLHFYSGGTHVTDALVATGRPGHLSPLGVFSVIERDRYHHSNIYDNAPMPFMERITWSGVALHEGAGLGHQASHGCIRMPHDFALKLWNLHTMGMRVIIARPELRPVEFADPHLFVHRSAPAISSTGRSTGVKTAQVADPNRTTDAINTTIRAAADTVRAADPNTVPVGRGPHPVEADNNAAAPSGAAASDPTKDGAPNQTAQANPPAADAPANGTSSATPNASDTTAAAPNTTDTTANGTTTATPNSTDTNAGANAPAPAPVAATPTPDSAAVAQPANPAPAAPAKPTRTATPAPSKDEGPAATAAVPNLSAPINAVLDDVPLPLAKPVTSNTSGPIAVFVSRKESKIYVRQNTVPVFEATITIDHRDQPIGTHVYTALSYLEDGKTFRWNVVSLPGEPQRVAKESKTERHGKTRHTDEADAHPVVDTPSPGTAKDALARIQIPQDVIEQISELMVPGSSLVVSDQGLGPETGLGTDFIVITH